MNEMETFQQSFNGIAVPPRHIPVLPAWNGGRKWRRTKPRLGRHQRPDRSHATVGREGTGSTYGEKPKLWGPSIVGFGSYHYKYDSGREGDMPLISFSPRKSALVLYSMLDHSKVKPLLPKLGKHRTGKGCLYIKKLADVDKKVLETLIENAVAHNRARKGTRDSA
jgi:Domain of unknown function (DU1801)